MFFCSCALLSLLFATNQTLSVDWASFNYDNGIALVEIYYTCPYNVFQYQLTNDTISASYQTMFRLKSLEGSDSIREISSHRAILKSFELAERRDMKLLDGFGFFARAGKYLLELHIFDKNFQLVKQDTLIVPDFSRSPSLSDLELASSVIVDSSGGKFTKGNMRIMPNPDLSFGSAYQYIYAYYETYNLASDTLPLELSYTILAENKEVVKSFPKEMKKKSGSSFGNTFALSTKGLKPGKYSLKLNLTDLGTNQKDSTEKSFWIVAKDTTIQITSSGLDSESLEKEIRFLATPTELSQYNNLNEVGKKEYLKKFWQKNNLEEFTSRVKIADNKYRQGNVMGRDTDRGRILIKYGQPDEIEVHTMIEHTRPHEHWHYYTKGYHFIFIDIRGNNNFQLIYSNSDNEPKNPNWENYVDPLELDDLK